MGKFFFVLLAGWFQAAIMLIGGWVLGLDTFLGIALFALGVLAVPTTLYEAVTD